MIGAKVGPYEVTAKLGEGGMGEVYRATDTKLDRQVAIKVLPATFTEDRDRLARFEREAKLLAQLQHPNIASIYGLEESDGARALVLELVEGPTLAERLEQGPLPLDEALPIALQVAEALEAAHEKGIIHRDLKPQNIKASADGRVKVLDFGLAKAMDLSSPGSAADLARSPTLLNSPTLTAVGTQLGVILGTAAYMAPEQARGRAVDKRADIWAFGVVLYEMLTGRSLFASDTVTDTLAGVLRAEVDLARLPEATPPAIRRLLRRCLERSPKNRLHDIADARIVVVETLAGVDQAPQGAERVPSRLRSRVLAGTAALAFAVASYVVGQRTAPAPAERGESGSPTFQRLTSWPGVEASPALSPDGKTLYFVAAAPGREDRDIFFTPVGGKKPIDLTADCPDDDSYPAVSPDGRQIAFRSERTGGGIFVMGATGESVRRLADGCFDPAWSPDGARIACTTCPSSDPLSRPCHGVLWVIEIATGARRTIEVEDAAAPAWSPDGRRLAYWGLRGATGQRDLWTVALDGGAPVELTHDPAVDWNPTWSPDGSTIAFVSDRGGAPSLWSVAVDQASGRPLATPRNLVLPSEYADDIHRVGERWVYVSNALRATVEVQGLDLGRLALVGPARTAVAVTGRLQYGSVSPDGRTIAYCSYLPQGDLFVVGVDGGAPVQLTDDQAFDRFPIWDPDGERILFLSNRSGPYQIWAIRPDGSGMEQLTAGDDNAGWVPLLSPDRTLLAVTTSEHLAIFDARGAPPWSESERFRDPQAAPGSRFNALAWSPDGTRIAGYEETLAERQIAVWSVAERRLQRLDVPGIGIGWLPDGRSLVVSGGGVGLRVVDVATGAVRAVVGGETYAQIAGWLSRDLATMVDFRNQREADIWLAEGIE